MAQVLDYSWGRPSLSSIKSLGVVGVMRYLSFDTSGKNITPDEAQALTAAGLAYGCVWESTANRVQAGASAGTIDATEALRQAQTLGYSGALYFAIDYDAPESDQPAINAYFQAVAAIIGLGRLGGYGGYWPIKRLFDAGLITLGWQTLAWSGGNKEARCSLYQTGAVALGADVNDVLNDNWSGISSPTAFNDAVVETAGLPAHDEPNLTSGWNWYYDNQEHITLLSKTVGELVTTGPYPNTRWWYQTDKGWVSDAYVKTQATPPAIPDYVPPVVIAPTPPVTIPVTINPGVPPVPDVIPPVTPPIVPPVVPDPTPQPKVIAATLGASASTIILWLASFVPPNGVQIPVLVVGAIITITTFVFGYITSSK